MFGHPRRTWVFWKLQGLQYYFPENFRCNLTYYESKNFTDSFLHHIFESKILGCLFSTKNIITCGVKYEKLNFRKSLGIYYMTRFIEIWNRRPLLMFAYSIGEHQQGSSVEVINFLRLICLEVTNSHINGIPVRQQDFGSTKNSVTN